MKPFDPDFRFREAPPAFEDYQRFILEHYDAQEVPISAFTAFIRSITSPGAVWTTLSLQAICGPARPGMKSCMNAPGTEKSRTISCWNSFSVLWIPAVPNSPFSYAPPWASHGRIMRATPCAAKPIFMHWRRWKKESIKISKKACFSP